MFVVFADNGTREIGGRRCHVWRGIPGLGEVMARVESWPVQGMQIEVGNLRLPDSQANTFTGSGNTFGSYDGRTLTVIRSLHGGSTTDVDIRATMLRSAYNGVCRLYFGIFHGLVEGEYKTAPDAGQQT